MISASAMAATYPLPPQGSALVGTLQQARASSTDTIESIARRYDMGYFELLEANPDIMQREAVKPTETVLITSQFILPQVPKQGLVINLAEMRLYYYPEGGKEVMTFPVGIGREGWSTPLGKTEIITKVEQPTWYVPASIRKARAKQGVQLPLKVPPGPDNPLGDYALILKMKGYLIHGTNRPDGVGRRSSAGCLRMYPEDIKTLFPLVKVGIPVRIINEPFKIGWVNGALYLEAHGPLTNSHVYQTPDVSGVINNILLTTKHHPYPVNWRRVKYLTDEQSGIPTPLGAAPKERA